MAQQEFKTGERVVAYSCEKYAKELRYRSASFHGTIEEIKNGIATIKMKDGHRQYHYLCCLRHEDEVNALWEDLDIVTPKTL